MASRKMDDLHESIRDKARVFLRQCNEEGMVIVITCTLRSMEEQTALYAQGREDIAKVNALRQLAGMPPLGTENRIVTHARPGYSLHNFGLAFDVVPLDAGKPIWDSSHPVWHRIGKTGKEAGLEWAGDWKRFKEYPHFQYSSGLSLAEIQEGKRPGTQSSTLGASRLTEQNPMSFLGLN
jgi:peptidoglycan L-alanyl-D-glutamate endopeptidase CwlK